MISATSEASGYGASNLSNPRILKTWRSTATTQQQIELDLGADVAVAGVLVTHTNAPSMTVEKKPAGGSYSSVGTLTVQQEPHGRRKGLLDAAGTYRYVRLTIANGTPGDGAAYWYIGAVYVFGVKTVLARGPEWPVQVNAQYPQVLQGLLNGRSVQADAGPAFALIGLDFRPLYSEDAALLLRSARGVIVGLSLDLSTRPWLVWPVMSIQGAVQIQAENVKTDRMTVELAEVV